MEEQLTKYKEMGEAIALYGQVFVYALIILVVGLIAIKVLTKLFKRMLERFALAPNIVSTISSIFYLILLFIVLSFALQVAGMSTVVIQNISLAVGLVLVGIIAVFRPLIPSLPFKVGNTVKVGDLLGKIEGTTILNTRMKTFDGKTVFIPNTKIITDFVINYHFTKTRRINLDVGIRYDQDLAKAKRVLEMIMIEDPRVLAKPAPAVYVLKLGESAVKVGGRCWVNNAKYWMTKCDLTEKTKFRFDSEEILFAYPQLDIHHYGQDSSPYGEKSKDKEEITY